MKQTWQVTGVDLAWGERMPDAIVTGTLRQGKHHWSLSGITVAYKKLSVGDLSNLLRGVATSSQLIAVDAPLVCKNETGSRPVDRECSALFRHYEAGCHPVNLNLVKRPIQIADNLRKKGVSISKDWQDYGSRAIEVYPHPTMIHWFGLEKTIKYKKGRVADKRIAFTEYQTHLKLWLENPPLKIEINEQISELLTASWTKASEDQLDAFFCLLIACWDVIHEGKRSLILGDNETGFIVIPEG